MFVLFPYFFSILFVQRGPVPSFWFLLKRVSVVYFEHLVLCSD